MKIKGVAFDLEGTVVNLEPMHEQAWQEVASKHGLSSFSIVPDFLGMGDPAIADHVSSKTRTPTSVLLELKHQHFDEHIRNDAFQSRDGWQKVYDYLQDQGLPMTIGSLTSRDRAHAIMDRAGLAQLIPLDYCVVREDVGKVKPAPDVYLKTAEIMGITPQEQLVFEDSPTGIKAGVAAGSKSVAVPVYHQATVQLVLAGPYRICRSWDDVLRDFGHRLNLG